MAANLLDAVTVLDVLLLLLSVLLGAALYYSALSIADRVARTGGTARAGWLAIGVALLGGGLWLLGLTTTLPFRGSGFVEYSVLPALLSAALAVTGTAFAFLVLEWERPAWLRLTLAAMPWGLSVAAVHYLNLSALGWRDSIRSDPAFTAQVIGGTVIGAGFMLWAVIAERESKRQRRWWKLLGALVATLAAPAAVYSAYIATGRGALAPDAEGRHFLLDPAGVVVTGGVVLLAIGAVVLAAGLDRRLRRRREETEALRRSEDRFRSLIQASSQIVWTTDPDGEMSGEQLSWSKFTGQEITAYRGWGWFNAIHPEDREATASVWQESLANRRSVEVEHRVRRYDGQYRDCVARVVPVLEPDGRVREWVGTHTDVTERARMQEERDLLASAGRVLSSSLDERETLSAIAGLIVPRLADWCAVDIRTAEGKIERVVATHADPHRTTLLREIHLDLESANRDRGAARVLATGESEMFREVNDETLRTLGTDDEDFQRLREVGVASLLTVPLTARRQVLGVLTLALAEEGEPYDLRDLALAEELARRSAIAIDNARLYSASRAAIEARDEMMSIVSHDLRNPLSTIMMTSDLLLDLPGASDDQRRHLQTMGRAATAMNRLIRDLLDAGQAESGRLAVDRRPIDPTSLAREACESMAPLAAEKGQRLTCDVQQSLPSVNADAARLQQVLSNLLGNAVKFAPEGGSVHLKVAQPDASVLFSVVDDGPGIPAEDLPRVFDRHWRSKETAHLGAGLGLAISKAIVEAHGGAIWAESDAERGSAFHFTIPVRPGEVGETQMAGKGATPDFPRQADMHLVAGDF